MAKHYDLVGSVYDKYSKGNKYKEEEIIKIPGVTFNSLEDIDKFTASLSSSYSLSRKLGDQYQDKNTFSIRITNSDSRIYYKSIIYNNPALVKIAGSLKQKTVYTPSGPKTVKMYLGNDDLFIKTFNTVLNKIEDSKVNNETREWLYGVFGEESRYTTLINRYINGDVFDSETYEILSDLKESFREYDVFRKYLTNGRKTTNKSKVSNVEVISSNIPVKTSLHNIEDKLGSNISYIPLDNDDYDKEEFFDDKEIEMMAGDGNIPHNFRGRRI